MEGVSFGFAYVVAGAWREPVIGNLGDVEELVYRPCTMFNLCRSGADDIDICFPSSYPLLPFYVHMSLRDRVVLAEGAYAWRGFIL